MLHVHCTQATVDTEIVSYEGGGARLLLATYDLAERRGKWKVATLLARNLPLAFSRETGVPSAAAQPSLAQGISTQPCADQHVAASGAAAVSGPQHCLCPKRMVAAQTPQPFRFERVCVDPATVPT